MIRAILVFVGAYVIYGLVYGFLAASAVQKSGLGAKVSYVPEPASLWGFAIVLVVTYLVCKK